jgi:hypothetical protein
LHWELFSLLIRAIKFFSVSGITSFQLLTPKLAFAPDSIEAAPTSSLGVFFIVLTCLLLALPLFRA